MRSEYYITFDVPSPPNSMVAAGTIVPRKKNRVIYANNNVWLRQMISKSSATNRSQRKRMNDEAEEGEKEARRRRRTRRWRRRRKTPDRMSRKLSNLFAHSHEDAKEPRFNRVRKQLIRWARLMAVVPERN